MEVICMHAVGITHIGKVREQNQDAIFVKSEGYMNLPNLFIVADGLGGHLAGSVASNTAMEAFCNFLYDHKPTKHIENSLVSALCVANEQVYNDAVKNKEHKGMGTTFSVVVVHEEKVHYAHVGDSRVYLIKDDAMTQITKDHFSLTADMVRDGVITQEEAKKYPASVLTRAIGTDLDVKIDKGVVALEGASHILICSDGLTNMVDNENILKIIKNFENLEQATQALIDAALDGGGLDNISAILVAC